MVNFLMIPENAPIFVDCYEIYLFAPEFSLDFCAKWLYNEHKTMIGEAWPLGEVLAVLSGKGGTGKTSVCAGVATALAELGEKVLCIDCDVGLRNLDISLGLSDSGALSFRDVCSGGFSLDHAEQHPSCPNLRFLTAPMNCGVEEIDADAFGAMLRQARSMFDYIFLDAPAGVDAGFRLVTDNADRFLVVTGAGPAAVRDASRVGELLELAGKKNIRLVVNRVDRSVLSAVHITIDDVMDTSGLPLIGVVLEDPCVILAASFGQMLIRYAKRCDAAKAFRRIARRIQGYSEPMKLH